ncbi:MAG: hypothetical protein ABL928_10405 [Sphingorhabdus sp.]
MKFKHYAALGLAFIAPMSLSGCLLLPGEFVSDMTILKSGEFSFSYKGEIQLVGLANLLKNELEGEGLETTEFTATCYGKAPDARSKEETEKEKKKEAAKQKAQSESYATEAALGTITGQQGATAASRTSQEDFSLNQDAEVEETSAEDAAEGAADAASDVVAAAAEAAADGELEDGFEERDCTETEIAEQKKDWDEQQVRRKKEKEQAKKMFAALLGGVDPDDPKTIERFTKEVERLAAWNKVEHMGNGVFKIDYSTKGRLADDFAFPVIPRYALGNPMIHISRWDNGRVRIEAPTFHNDPDMSMAALMGAGGMMPGMGMKGKGVDPLEVKGTFTIRTDTNILANNSEEGPSDVGGLQVLTWDIGARTFGPPMALLKLVN